MSDLEAGRFPLLLPDSLESEQRSLYWTILGGERASGSLPLADEHGSLRGPFNALLYVPDLGAVVERLGSVLRFSSGLAARTRELVICTVAAHWDSRFEWYAHRQVACEVGVTSEELRSIRRGLLPESVSGDEAAALRLAHALLRDRIVSRGIYDEVSRRNGLEAMVELCVLVGYYQLLAGVLATGNIPAPEDDLCVDSESQPEATEDST